MATNITTNANANGHVPPLPLPSIPNGMRQSRSRWAGRHANVINAVCAFVCGDEMDALDRVMFADLFEHLVYMTSDNALRGGGFYAYEGVEVEASRHIDSLMIRGSTG